MPTTPSSPTPKPVSAVWQPELTRLPVLTPGRRFVRRLAKFVCRSVVMTCTRLTVRGLENYPRRGPALVVMNHLGDPDVVLMLALLPDFPELIGKIELRQIGWLRRITDMLGIIWVHRGRPDRRALSAALDALRQGRRVLIAPEGRESVTGMLEEGEDGAAFLALRSGVRLVPVTLTGSEGRRIEDGIKQKHRTPVTLTIGRPFTLEPGGDRHEALRDGTRLIMETLARQLPAEYRGVYSYVQEDGD